MECFFDTMKLIQHRRLYSYKNIFLFPFKIAVNPLIFSQNLYFP